MNVRGHAFFPHPPGPAQRLGPAQRRPEPRRPCHLRRLHPPADSPAALRPDGRRRGRLPPRARERIDVLPVAGHAASPAGRPQAPRRPHGGPMIKIIVLLLGLAIGFGGGVWYGVRHPEEGKKIADEEERRVLEKQKELVAKLKTKLDQLASSRTGTAGVKTPGTGFLSGAPAKDPEVDSLDADADKQLAELDKVLKKK